jgi:cytochrome c peroxidase
MSLALGPKLRHGATAAYPLLPLAAVMVLELAAACSSGAGPGAAGGANLGGTTSAAPGAGGLGEGGASGGLAGGSSLGGEGGALSGTPYPWSLPQGFPKPLDPSDNPTTVEKVELGRHLFYDVRLSNSDTMSCASCHKQELAFTDGRVVPTGSTGETLPRNSMSLANVGYAATLTWANPLFKTLERQALIPMFGEAPIELGLKSAADVEEKLARVPRYSELFAAAYPDAERALTLEHITQALGAFQRTLVSGNSPYDRWIRGDDPAAMGAAALRGYRAFNSEKFECFHCHVGFNLTDSVYWDGKPFFEAPFHNTGLYNIDGKGAYPEPNTGVHSVTGDESDMGRFKAPTLRNIAVTAPYMHDGSIATLEEVLAHYGQGGRTISEGANAGVGSLNPHKSNLLVGFELSEDERRDLLAFFAALTDRDFLENPEFSNPWP